jgi:hypothetical protein
VRSVTLELPAYAIRAGPASAHDAVEKLQQHRPPEARNTSSSEITWSPSAEHKQRRCSNVGQHLAHQHDLVAAHAGICRQQGDAGIED